MVNLGYHNRGVSIIIYTLIIISLFVFHNIFLKHIKRRDPVRLGIVVTIILLLSYPFLSHDFFNYMFDARILTVHGQNPYLFKALDFPNDQWLRFLQWTHRTYPYGPTFLPLTIIPSFLAFGKFSLSFVFFKILICGFYLSSIFFLNKLNKTWAIFFATHPLIIIEGLINGHNDLIAVSLALVGIYYLYEKRGVLSRVLLLASGGIKYITLPLVLLQTKDVTNKSGKKNESIFSSPRLTFIVLTVIVIYLSFTSEIQPWYFLNYFALLPFFYKTLHRSQIFFAGLLLSYYPYVYLGGWDSSEKILLKHNIIIVFAVANIVYLIIRNRLSLKE